MNGAELKIGKFIENHTGDMIKTLAELVKIPSVKGTPDGVYPFGREPARALEKFLDIAEGMGFTVKNHENYVGTIDLFPSGEPTLGILCHLDVVPEGGGWNTPPYELTLSRGYLYGRGAIDDKGPAVSVLYAMYALRKLGVPLSQNVRFILGTDEENGSADLAYYRKKETLPERLFTPDGSYPVINVEKGMIRGEFRLKISRNGDARLMSLYGGQAVNAVPGECVFTLCGIKKGDVESAAANVRGIKTEINDKDGTLTVTVRGKSAHASLPDGGLNAVTAALDILSSLNVGNFAALSRLFPYGECDGAHAGVKMSDDVSGDLTFVHSVAECDGEEYRGKFDVRFPVTSSVEEVKKRLEKTFVEARLRITSLGGVEGHYVDENGEFIKTLLETYEHISGKRGRCIAIGGGTYVHETENGVAFGAEFADDDNRMHAPNERMSVELFKMNARMYADAIIRLCK